MKQPGIKDERLLLSLQECGVDLIEIPRTGKRVRVGWMRGYTLERLSRLELKEGAKSEDADTVRVIGHRAKFMAKAASLCLLNGIRIVFLHWLYWRYLYYVRGYAFDQLEPVLVCAKKKVPAGSWYIGSALVNQMKITSMTMTMEEAERFRAALSLEQEQR